MSETEVTAEAVADEVAAPEQADADAAQATQEQEQGQDPDVVAIEEEVVEEAIPQPVGPAAGRQARVFLCERGHRTVAVWSDPTTCRARPTRRTECGRQLYPIGELPEQVQKALNPLKASKKASKG